MERQEVHELSSEESPSKYGSPSGNITYRTTKGPGQVDTRFHGEMKAFQAKMTDMFKKWFTKQDEKMDKLTKVVEELKSTITSLSDRYVELHKRTEVTENRVVTLEGQCLSAVNKISGIEARLDEMEQQSRHCNMEISNLPEKRGENLMLLIESIATTIKQPAPAQYITAIHRVPQLNPKSSHPKNIIVRFNNQVIRDNFISAVRKKKGMTTEQLGMSGPAAKVYVNEHLTLKNKTLFREAREAAKKHGYRYVWVKHGHILVRANDTSPAFAIRKKEDVFKIKPQKQLPST